MRPDLKKKNGATVSVSPKAIHRMCTSDSSAMITPRGRSTFDKLRPWKPHICVLRVRGGSETHKVRRDRGYDGGKEAQEEHLFAPVPLC